MTARGMTGCPAALVLAALACTLTFSPTRADTNIASGQCGVAAGGNAVGKSVTCNFGLSPEQLKLVTQAAVQGATAAQAEQFERVRQVLGVTEDAAKRLLKIVGEDANLPEDKLAEALTRVAEDFGRLNAQVSALNPVNPAARALIDEAKAEISAGRFAPARERLRDATEVQLKAARDAREVREKAEAAEEAQSLGAAGSTAAEGDVAMTERKFAEAAKLFGLAAGYVPPSHRDERGDYLLRQADALTRQGAERGDNDALSKAAEVCRSALTETTRSEQPVRWANLETTLGAALRTLGERESGTPNLEDAIGAYRASLTELKRDKDPIAWAMAENNLGAALETLGERESGTQRLRDAVTAFEAALSELNRETAPFEWAAAENNLGDADLALADREDDPGRRKRAIEAYRAALAEITREKTPLDWARVEANLGVALEALGERDGDKRSLEDAIDAYRAALQELSRDRFPMDWAETEFNLGNALQAFGKLESGTARLDEAVAAYEEALKERTRRRAPEDWAETENALGAVLEELGARETGTWRLERAIAAYRAALEVGTEADSPWLHSVAAANLARCQTLLGDRVASPTRTRLGR
jgi:tetratricopeptide (TPR) repeat protein